MIKKSDFIKRKMEMLCQMCYRKARLQDELNSKLEEEDTLDNHTEQFNKIITESFFKI